MSRPAGSIIGATLDASTNTTSGIWTVPQVLDKISAGNWPASALWPGEQYVVNRSLRFRASASAYLNRTPASAGNRRTWTWSGWVKRGDITKDDFLFSAYNAANDAGFFAITITSTGQLRVQGWNTIYRQSNAFYRDPSAWYHFVVSIDANNATANDRIKVYVNGEQVVSFSTNNTYPQNTDTLINNNLRHVIGNHAGGSDLGGPVGNSYLDGYLTEINFIDGQALDPDSFGEYNEDTGVWQPKEYEGTYGTNGFYLNFGNPTTLTTLTADQSGNGNDWTADNISLTSGATFDSMIDTPTPVEDERGNFCVLNPLSTTAGTYSNANLRYVGASSWRRSNSTVAVSTDKWYWEVTLGNAPFSSRGSTSSYNAFGFGLSTVFNSTTQSSTTTDAVYLADNGYFKNFSGAWTDGGTGFSSGDTLAVAVDLTANTFTFYRNNTQITTGTIGGTAGRELVPIILSYDGSFGVMDANFGQRPFEYTPPSGFKALHTGNLPEPAIVDGGEYFNTVLYTGNGSTTRTITGVGFDPDFVWNKCRSDAINHFLIDRLRGAGNNLSSSTNEAEFGGGSNGVLNSVETDGFSILQGITSANNVNGSGRTFVAWNWKANGAGVTNTDGSITSTVSAGVTQGFSVVTYTGNGNAHPTGATIGHGLGVAPSMIIVKSRSTASTNWSVYHSSLSVSSSVILNGTGARGDPADAFNRTAPTSTVFSVGQTGGGSRTNENTATYVAYCFAEVPGYSRFGSYTGNGSADGPMVFLGFRPAFLMFKRTDNTANWEMYDSTRDTYNPYGKILLADQSVAESDVSSGFPADMLSNGFKIRHTGGAVNASGGTFIYMAFAENPFKYSLAR